ncbi:MAG: hypothetical protein ACRD9R_13925 [Pyrinomonadaceae bacterium]
MSDIKRVGDIEIGEDMRTQRRQWAIERIGWVLMLLVALAALAGLLGPGPLSGTSAATPDSLLQVEYNRFERRQSPVMLRVRLGPGAARGGQLRLSLNRDYVEGIQIERIEPEPDTVEAHADRYVYVFNAPDISGATSVTFRFEPNRYGRAPVRLWIEGGPQLSFRQFFYP